MNAFDWIAGALYLAILGLAIRWICRHLPGGRRATRPPLPYRSRDDVLADTAIARDCRHLAEAINDHDTVWTIWPNPPSARVIEAQWRHDTAKQRKEKGQ